MAPKSEHDSVSNNIMKMKTANACGFNATLTALVVAIMAWTGCSMFRQTGSYGKPPPGWKMVSVSVPDFEVKDTRYTRSLGEKAATELVALLPKDAFQIYPKKTNETDYIFRGTINSLSRSMKYETQNVFITVGTNLVSTNKTVLVTTTKCNLILKFEEPKSGRNIAVYWKDFSKPKSSDVTSADRQSLRGSETALGESESAGILEAALDRAVRDLMPEIYRTLSP